MEMGEERCGAVGLGERELGGDLHHGMCCRLGLGRGLQVHREPPKTPGALGLPWTQTTGREQSRGKLTTAVLPAGLPGGRIRPGGGCGM